MRTVSIEAPETWVPLTDEIFDRLYDRYCLWLDMEPEERAHMAALRRYEETVAALAEQNPPEHQAWRNAIAEWHALYETLPPGGRDALNPEQRGAVDAAQAKMEATYSVWRAICPREPGVIYSPEKSVRVERCKERIAALERAYNAGWRPLAGKKWPDPDVVAWCSMFSGARFKFLDDLESIIQQFETAHAEAIKFAADMRAGRIPRPSAPAQPTESDPRTGFGGYAIPRRTKFRRK